MTRLTTNSPLRSGVGLSASGQFLQNRSREGTSGIWGASANPNGVIRNRVNNNIVNDSFQYTFPLDLPPIHMNIVETDWKAASKTLTPRKMLRLPLPLQLKDAFDVQYDTNFALNPAAGIVGALGGDQLLNSAQVATGRTINSYKTVTLSQPNFRRHQFAWKLAPKTFQESETIQRIAFSLRKGMTPKRELDKFLMRFPFIYLLYFSPNPKFLYKMKPCVLERIETDFNGGNPSPAFYANQGGEGDQPPESITLTLTFLELEYWLDGDNEENTDYKTGENGLPTNDGLDAFNYYEIDPSGGSVGARTSGDVGTVQSQFDSLVNRGRANLQETINIFEQ